MKIPPAREYPEAILVKAAREVIATQQGGMETTGSTTNTEQMGGMGRYHKPAEGIAHL